MRRSSAPEGGRESGTAPSWLTVSPLARSEDSPRSPSRAQTEPFAALAAVFVVALALSVWAGAFEASLPGPVDRKVAEPTADRVERALTEGGVVRPERLTRSGPGAVSSRPVNRAAPEGYRLNVTVLRDGDRQSVGPAAPSTADAATRRVSAGRPGAVSPARLEVRVWTRKA